MVLWKLHGNPLGGCGTIALRLYPVILSWPGEVGVFQPLKASVVKSSHGSAIPQDGKHRLCPSVCPQSSCPTPSHAGSGGGVAQILSARLAGIKAPLGPVAVVLGPDHIRRVTHLLNHKAAYKIGGGGEHAPLFLTQ